jgi:hypothetical protein
MAMFGGAGAVVLGGGAAYILTNNRALSGNGTLPGASAGCTSATEGGIEGGSFFSHARNKVVEYTIGFSPGCNRRDRRW